MGAVLHIWYIEHYGGGPGIGVRYRPYHLARAWREQGHTATIFTASFHHLMEKPAQLDPEFSIDGIRYIAVPARSYEGNGVSRMLNMWDFTRNLYSAGKRFGRDLPPPQAVIASSPHPFTIYPGHRLARRHNARLVYEIRDIWPLSITEILGTSRFQPFVQLCAAAERFALAKSDLVASVLPRGDRYLDARGYGSKPFVWVPNGIGATNASEDLTLISDAAGLARKKLRDWAAEGRVTIIYTGAIGRPNAVDLLLEAVEHAQDIGEGQLCGVLIVGKGEQLDSLRAFARDKNLSNVHLSGGVPKQDALALLRDADIGYAGLRRTGSLFSYGISPNKIADYFGAALPVFLPIEPCGDLVSESGGGIAKDVQTPQAMWNELRRLIGLTPEERQALGALGKSYMTREYDYGRVAHRFAESMAAR